jgi:ankyrin repeat protein
MLPTKTQLVSGVTATICAVVFVAACSSSAKAPPEGEVKAAIAENIVRRVVRMYSADPDRAKVERQTYLQLLIDNMQLIKMGSYNEKEGSWPVEAKVHIPVSPASGGRGHDVFLAMILQLWGVGEPETYLLRKQPDGSFHARRSSEKEGEAEVEPARISLGAQSEEKEQPIAGLHEAAQSGDLDRAKALLDGGAEIDARDTEGMTPLCLAAGHGRTLVAKLLLEKGANIDTTCKGDYTPLHLAAWNGHDEIVDLLLQRGADVNAKVAGASALWMAASKGYTPIVRALISNGADINARDNGGYAPLHESAGGGHRQVVEILVEHGAQINVKSADEKGWTPLHFAVLRGSAETVKLLLSQGADPNVKGNDGLSPTMVAQRSGRSDIVALLETSKKR